MKKFNKISSFLFFAAITACIIYGCDEFIKITGAISNRLNLNDNFSGSVVIFIKNSAGKIIPNIQVNAVRPSDSLNISVTKFSEEKNPVIFAFPDEQTMELNKDESFLVIINHPDIGILSREVTVSELNTEKIKILEFDAGNFSDTLSKAPVNQYMHFKTF